MDKWRNLRECLTSRQAGRPKRSPSDLITRIRKRNAIHCILKTAILLRPNVNGIYCIQRGSDEVPSHTMQPGRQFAQGCHLGLLTCASRRRICPLPEDAII